MGVGAWRGGEVSPRITCVLAPNPGPMTLDGTNTWVLHEAGAAEAVVVDPGPLDEDHLRRVVDVVRSRGARVGLALLTHGHGDHADGARRFAELAGCPVRAYDPALCVGADAIDEGLVFETGSIRARVLATPGHTSDSVSFLLADDRALLTGDTVLGRGTTVVAYPDGALAPYLASLRRLRALVDPEAARGGASGAGARGGAGGGGRGGGADVAGRAPAGRLLPGHGPVVDDAAGVLDFYLAHRAERLDQVRTAVAGGARTPREVVERVYADVDPSLWPAAERSVRAQLDYLAEPPTVR